MTNDELRQRYKEAGKRPPTDAEITMVDHVCGSNGTGAAGRKSDSKEPAPKPYAPAQPDVWDHAVRK